MGKVIALAIAGILLGGNALLSVSSSADSLWAVSAGLDPGKPVPARPPLHFADVNPFALFGSPVGILLGGLYNQSSNTAEHMGMPMLDSVPFQTPLGNTLNDIYRGTAPSVHIHASHAISGKNIGIGARAEAIVAKRMVSTRLQRAYLLDPTNRQAFVSIETSLADSENPNTRAAAVHLAKHALSKYRTESGYWPEQCLSACQTLVDLWNAVGQPRGQYLVALDDKVREFLDRGRAQQQNLERLGIWQKRRPWMRALWDERIRYTTNLSNMIHAAVLRQEKGDPPPPTKQ